MWFDKAEIGNVFFEGSEIEEVYYAGAKVFGPGIIVPNTPLNIIQNFIFTGTVQSIVLEQGFYKLECWTSSSSGGYSYQNIYLSGQTTLYVVVSGGYSSPYNGGGAGVNTTGAISYANGATHIAKRTGELKNLSSYRADVLVVAGGSGGGGRGNY